MKLLNESIYWHGTGRITHCLNKLLQQILVCAAAIILTICFCKVKIFPLLEVTQKNYSLFYNRMKVCTANSFASVNVTDMDYQPNGITCPTSSESFALNGSTN
jgi:hypothetical protein